jgi:predicted Zn-dependent protease
MKRLAVAVAVAIAALVLMPGVEAYLKLGTSAGGRLVGLRWTTFPIRYLITNRSVNGVSADQLRAAIDAAFAEWARVEGLSIPAEFAGFTNVEPEDNDGLSVIGFQEQAEDENTLGATSFTINSETGQILESDIFLNTIFDWSVAGAGQAGRYDTQAIATHEIGHLLGLGHSALGETTLLESGGRRVLSKRAVMFPIAFPAGNIEDRTLEADDRGGITDIYAPVNDRRTGSISGRVTLNGSGIFGAHVIAFNPSTGEMVGSFALSNSGDFVISGLAPGLYVVRAEPLDDADLESFFSEDANVQINFRPAYAPDLVAVPPGGSSNSVEIKVPAK